MTRRIIIVAILIVVSALTTSIVSDVSKATLIEIDVHLKDGRKINGYFQCENFWLGRLLYDDQRQDFTTLWLAKNHRSYVRQEDFHTYLDERADFDDKENSASLFKALKDFDVLNLHLDPPAILPTWLFSDLGAPRTSDAAYSDAARTISIRPTQIQDIRFIRTVLYSFEILRIPQADFVVFQTLPQAGIHFEWRLLGVDIYSFSTATNTREKLWKRLETIVASHISKLKKPEIPEADHPIADFLSEYNELMKTKQGRTQLLVAENTEFLAPILRKENILLLTYGLPD